MARYNNKPIKASAKGTTRAKRALAFWRFSKAPPKCRVYPDGNENWVRHRACTSWTTD